MRKIIFTMFAAAAFFGCNREPIPVAPSEPGAISFGTVNTRAGLSDLQADGFGVWGILLNEANQNGYWVFDNEYVYMQEGMWTYDNQQLWVNNSMYGFFACYPQNIGFEMSTVETEGQEYPAVVLKDFVTPDAADTDVIVATNITDTTAEEYDEEVKLTFQHIFSRVNIRVQQNKGTNERDQFIIDKITLRNVKVKGTCSYIYCILPRWTYDTSVSKTFTTEIPGDDIINFQTGIMMSDNGFLLLPQTITPNSIELEVAFRAGLEGVTDLNNFESKTYKAYLPATVNWEAGKSYAYTAQVSTYSPIVFLAPTVESWGGSQSGGTIIIK